MLHKFFPLSIKQYQSDFSTIFQAPSAYRNHNKNKSLNICIDANSGSNFDPSISVHWTATSAIGILSISAIFNNSTSNAHLSIWQDLNNIRAVFLVNNLKPHCVSKMKKKKKILIKKLKHFSLNHVKYENIGYGFTILALLGDAKLDRLRRKI